jgi:predicted metal-dependent phosphoesterase TrpH
MAALARPPAADLHVHTTISDGEFTPSQVVAFARAARLAAVAITDHDTLDGFALALANPPGGIEVIPGVEWTTELDGCEFHILGLFLDPANRGVRTALEEVCTRRRERFENYLLRLERGGVSIPDGMAPAGVVSLGRRHLAGLLVRTGVVRNRAEAFRRFLNPLSAEVPAAHRTPARRAIELIRGAGGLAALAHPPAGIEDGTLSTMRDLGLAAVEVSHPSATATQTARLRELARERGLAVTAGSDCHGPDPAGRRIGSRGVSREELAALRELAGRPG